MNIAALTDEELAAQIAAGQRLIAAGRDEWKTDLFALVCERSLRDIARIKALINAMSGQPTTAFAPAPSNVVKLEQAHVAR